MAGMMEITLERDGHDQPWGFRLQGGHDVGMPLSIQRVLVGTPAYGILKKGDVIIKISQTDAKALSHQQAADLFTNTGNQIFIQFKRAGAPPKNTSAQPSSQSVPVSGGVALPGMTTKAPGRSPDPYRTSPLIQPSAKIDVGPGSAGHLKKQAEYLSGAKEPQFNFNSRPSDFAMTQKVAGTLQQIQQTGPKSPVPMASSQANPNKQYYNNPMSLYSDENVADVARMNKMGMSAIPASHTGPIHPTNQPHKPMGAGFPIINMGGFPKKYNPEASATWQAIHEAEKCELVTEHGPASSKVYFV